ncbi:diguanylate cyclase/phosphodiesterase (GGDEF & EAL domains) with PAS/PAC sensor(s) [Paramagnetospirillum magnetotacticum MS-1]|uniref:Diguanylate cyclase/phosphodiesterase (GGDEF & EAL domains) with PAS/PAC sensor(S) n=1 Tax=Paramagnetospirillum magnetotacticum MS-1 TaxID=272627 RepID=A0A0C2YRR2_PARME|nr:bifunctional diguanylate cyclase/phosphodiesterase [Paramagnetospirillum magnetotacticum]KIL97395.1 diguanylate cyclase/phosphodiesterase (GGDEF & EAL domains) with PAS/PAC sensor(s) [Paramagnetospirillum magnetotacticum MS-1]
MNGMAFDPFLSSLTDAAEMGLVLLDGEGRAVLWNAWLAEASGIPAAAAVGRTIAEIFPSLSEGSVAEAIGLALDGGLPPMLSSSADSMLFPLTRSGSRPDRRVDMHQIVVIKPLEAGGRRAGLVQIFDVTSMASRETQLRQQALTMEALAENYRLSELHNRAIVDNTADAIVTFSEDGAIGTYNPSAERIFGYAPPEIVGKPIALLIPELVRPDPFLDHRTEVIGVRKTRAHFPLELSLAAMELGGQRLFVAIGHDITLRKANEAELLNQREWLTTLINALPDLICFKDGKGRWLVANQFYLDLVGLAGVDYVGRTGPELARLSHNFQEFLTSAKETDERAWKEGKALSYEKTMETPSRGTKVFDMLKIPLFHADGKRRGLVLVGRDVTERKMTAARIQRLAHHDSLTDLPNRVLFQERLRQSLAQAKRSGWKLALMFLDLDKFKDVNDTLGHHVGDLLLRAVAKRLIRCVRETDTVARLGGDEFAVLLTNLDDLEGASRVAETIIAGISDPFGLEEHEVRTSTSIGITIYPDDSSDAEQLLKNADLAMFRSKAEGRNNYHFYVAQMDAEVRARKLVEHDLRLALGTEQLELHYQPLVEMSTRRIVGCEALLRWNHPTRGWMPPGEFIPIIERSDLIGPLGRWILHRACQQGREWQKDGLEPMKIAVNLSPAQFKQTQSIISMVADILDQTGFAPDQLQLEITEGIAMQNVDATIEVLQGLRAMGVLISIDDFGTGYSSLNYLKRFPVDKLKIDRSFVVDIGQHPDNAAVVQAIVNLGHSLRTRVNVEGIETQEQLDFLQAHKVDEAQGFYFSKAVPADQFAELVRTKSPWPL